MEGNFNYLDIQYSKDEIQNFYTDYEIILTAYEKTLKDNKNKIIRKLFENNKKILRKIKKDEILFPKDILNIYLLFKYLINFINNYLESDNKSEKTNLKEIKIKLESLADFLLGKEDFIIG